MGEFLVGTPLADLLHRERFWVASTSGAKRRAEQSTTELEQSGAEQSRASQQNRADEASAAFRVYQQRLIQVVPNRAERSRAARNGTAEHGQTSAGLGLPATAATSCSRWLTFFLAGVLNNYWLGEVEHKGSLPHPLSPSATRGTGGGVRARPVGTRTFFFTSRSHRYSSPQTV